MRVTRSSSTNRTCTSAGDELAMASGRPRLSLEEPPSCFDDARRRKRCRLVSPPPHAPPFARPPCDAVRAATTSPSISECRVLVSLRGALVGERSGTPRTARNWFCALNDPPPLVHVATFATLI